MIYLTEKHIIEIGYNWKDTIREIEKAIFCLKESDYAQPVKPYLRYRNLKNRIIAMPAFVGGTINKAGIKWIASFPDNIKNNMSRASSIIIINDSDSGQPQAIINTPLISTIRTVSVSGYVIQKFLTLSHLNKFNVGIVGWGPIGQHHARMIASILGNRLSVIKVYDKVQNRILNSNLNEDINIETVGSWQEAFTESDIFITCTVSDEPYINLPPKTGSLQLNVSLRDYKTSFYQYVKDSIIVDDWDEVCRENTDIERFHIHKGFNKENAKTIISLLENNFNEFYKDKTIMFNPMGMGIFDITIANYFIKKAIQQNIGDLLSD